KAQSDDARRAAVVQSGQQRTDEGSIRLAQRWWLERMRTATYPLEERMTLMWHGHFATAVRYPYPDVAMILVQNQTLRTHALGNLGDLVKAVTVDPAMMEWLDGARNSIPAPNENYARELMELFTLGKYPQVYGEEDVRQAARVLTGWTDNVSLRTVSFDAAGHDTGTKTVLGTTIGNGGAQEYAQLVDLLLSQPISARFIAAKLVSNFAYAAMAPDLLRGPDSLVVQVADTLQATGGDLRAAMRTLLLSDEFRLGDAGAQRLLVRQPVEAMVAAAKAFGITLDNDDAVLQLRAMGQPLFVPPNVGGFPAGMGWLSPSTIIARYGWAETVGTRAANGLPASSDVDGWARRAGLGALTAETVAALESYVTDNATLPESAKQMGVAVLLLTSPEWMAL
ncbi:MAG TPA: DUF1800 domain-containing protein, partial [Acidimicrobiales bacterium]|nr:DUF1800 domain-containing protein [Acidimicrobiales bacterium]